MPEQLLRILEATAGEPQRREAFDPKSIDGKLRKIRDAFAEKYPYKEGEPGWWVEDTYEDHLIANHGDETHRFSYAIAEDGAVTFGEPEKVEISVSYSSATESVQRTREISNKGGSLLESLDDGAGWVWRVTMVKPGVSKNGRRYQPEVLREAVSLYEGAKSFDGHRDDMARRSSSVAGMAGWHESVTVDANGALQSDFHISPSAPHVRQLFLAAYEANRPDLVGFSHDVSAMGKEALDGKRKITDITKILEVHSVDVVADPSAGGKIERLVASSYEEGEHMDPEQLRALLDSDPTLAAAAREHLGSSGEPDPAATPPAPAATPPAPAAAPPATPAGEPEEGAGATESVSGTLRRLVINEAFAESGLPESLREKITATIPERVTEAAIRESIRATADLWAAAAGARPSGLPGQTQVTVTEAERDKMQKALDGMLDPQARPVDGITPFRSIKQAYSAFSGRHPYAQGDEDFNRWLLAESAGAIPEGARITESLNTGSWGEALGDSLTRRLIAEYNFAPLNTWRAIVSEISPIEDFRTQRRDRVGGYDTLPVVGQGAPYQALTSPTDEEATFGITKKGGLEDFTLEMAANDDLRALRRIPVNLGRAAALTLYRAIWIDTIVANAAIYDSVALFHASHNNTTAAALGEAGLTTLRNLMVTQTRLGESSGFIGVMPKFIVVPSELAVLAFKLTNSNVAVVSGEDATTPNFYKGMETIEVPLLTDADDWYMIGDPATIPTIEVGFYQGRQEPELLIQDQPSVGSVFTADKFTWKIRHIWGLTVLDYRGFQRGTQ